MLKILIPLSAMALALFSSYSMAHSPAASAKVFFENIQDGDTVKSPFTVTFGIKGFGITPAGTTGKIRHTAGHHHLLINVDSLPDLDEAIPNSDNYQHFDQGEVQTQLTLPPGQHSLQLLLGDEQHEPQDPALYSSKITITVK